jgi:hypothetical protein
VVKVRRGEEGKKLRDRSVKRKKLQDGGREKER